MQPKIVKCSVTTKARANRTTTSASTKKDQNFKIIARSDAKSVEGIDKMIDRCKAYIDAGAEIISVHVEANNPKESLKRIQHKGIKSGIAFNPSTPKDEIIPLLDFADMILVMSVEPGYCGQSFHENAIDRVNFFKTNYPKKIIEVDGGVSTENSAILAKNGADILVAGSAIFKSDDPIETIIQMKKS